MNWTAYSDMLFIISQRPQQLALQTVATATTNKQGAVRIEAQPWMLIRFAATGDEKMVKNGTGIAKASVP